jgi:elongation factor 3
MPGLISKAPSQQTELQGLLPSLQNAGKKSPPGPRIQALEQLSAIVASAEFPAYEPYGARRSFFGTNPEISGPSPITHLGNNKKKVLILFPTSPASPTTTLHRYIVSEMLPTIFARLDDKPAVIAAAEKVGQAIVAKLSIQAFSHTLPLFCDAMNTEAKWRTKIGALKLLGAYIIRVESMDRDLLSACLPELMPMLTPMLHDTKPEVESLAVATTLLAMKGITNRDIEPFTDALLRAMQVREETEETIQKLGGVVFVQNIEGSALSVVVPLLVAGFRQSKALVKRMCARIVGNMSKLVNEPLEAAPFLGTLIPALFDAIDTIADPEARDVATKTHAALEKIEELAAVAAAKNAFRNTAVIFEQLSAKLAMPSTQSATIRYIAAITSALIKTKTTDIQEYVDELKPYLQAIKAGGSTCKWLHAEALKVITVDEDTGAADDDEGEDLCDCEFTLAYGTKILLHNTRMRLKKGKKYGLLGQNDCGKTTLMRAVAEGSVDGFPDGADVKTVFVEADIQGELSHLDCVHYILEWPAIKELGATEQQVRDVLLTVGFSEGKAAGSGGDCDDPISSLSGGWRMKLALARAMLQKADILLMDEPTNHLDVKNVKWVESYINSLTTTTVIMVSHDSGLLDHCCNYILQITQLKLKLHKGNLSAFVATHPEAKSYFEFKANKFKFSFPQPSFLEGVKSRGKALMKMDNVTFCYPGNTVPTISDISIRASMASRVACVGVNGAGKSTMIKVLTGELEPTAGTIWKYPNTRVGYIAQHAFHHIESHLEKTPNEYIRWRFEFGDDREGLDKANMKLSEKDAKALAEPVEYTIKDEKGKIKKEKRVISKCTGQRRDTEGRRKEFEYEVSWKEKSVDSNSWFTQVDLVKFHKTYEKVIRMIDAKIAARENMFSRALTQGAVEQHLNDVGLEPEYGTHFRINALSGGQKVKVVLAAAMWDQPHILILDEPTNYLDRDSLGALADAIDLYEGGVIMITHNDAFCRQLCPERWVLEAGKLNTEGDVEWMQRLQDTALEFKAVEEMVDATGNIKTLKKKLNAKEKKKMMKIIAGKIADGADLDSEEDEYAIEWNL